MGGHSAWRKRVAEGRLAKEGTGGAIARHRPRFGRMGLVRPSKKGGESNPKKQSGRRKTQQATSTTTTAAAAPSPYSTATSINSGWTTQRVNRAQQIIFKWGMVAASGIIYLILKYYYQKNHSEEEFPDI